MYVVTFYEIQYSVFLKIQNMKNKQNEKEKCFN